MTVEPPTQKKCILEVKDLTVTFAADRGETRAVDGLSLKLFEGETHCIVGESGCGKTVTGLSILRLLPKSALKALSGEVWFDGQNIMSLGAEQLRRVRGRGIAMVFQEPMSSLNPVFRIGTQLIEAIRIHQSLTRKQARAYAIDLLRLVGIPGPEERIDDFPHQLSGGMRQRVMIAMALSCNPKVLIADEPTTALDVTVQAQVLQLLRDLQRKTGMALILITHDFGVVAEMADQVSVMYAGQIIETGSVNDVLGSAAMPYTHGLLKSIPVRGKQRLDMIPGSVPDLMDLPPGCRFRDRCSLAEPSCSEGIPELLEVSSGHAARCIKRGTFK